MINKKILIYGMVILLILNLTDGLITIYGINKGVFKEANPIAKKTMETPGLFETLKLIILSAIILLTTFSISKNKHCTENQIRTMTFAVWITVYIYMFTVVWAFSILYMERRT